jgi:hypothetical protein
MHARYENRVAPRMPMEGYSCQTKAKRKPPKTIASSRIVREALISRFSDSTTESFLQEPERKPERIAMKSTDAVSCLTRRIAGSIGTEPGSVRRASPKAGIKYLMMAAVLMIGAVPCIGRPLLYQSTVVTDIKLAGHTYHKAAVTLSFAGDSDNTTLVVDKSGNPLSSGAQYCNGTGYFFWLPTGTASLVVESGGRTHRAHFSPNQIFVALDTCNGGIGFGSYIGPNGLEPAYPLAFTLGTAMAFAENTLNALATEANMSGNAWSCIGYPPTIVGTDGNGNGLCFSPDLYPLHTDVGDVVFYMPYTESFLANHVGALNRGTFSIMPPQSN